jgi:hypothetical protein
LALAIRKQNREGEAGAVDAEFQESWKHADTPLAESFVRPYTPAQAGVNHLSRSAPIRCRLANRLQTARFFAQLWTGFADSFIGCMNAKYHFGFWRPITTIRNADLDNNADTLADPAWTPLGTTPSHPEFPAAHGCVTGAVAKILEAFFRTPNVKLLSPTSVLSH